MFPEGFDFNDLLAQAQSLQEQMLATQTQLQAASYIGTAGGGLVSVVLRGDGELERVDIKAEVVDLDDLEALGDLIVAAYRDANSQVKTAAASALPQIPGFDAGQLGL
ncbi:MAG: YbaB/EbfC family nucleoid-associated protein [Propionibacteriaceae bacterium]|jgi:DNA-binding YbaB/EbfC family protein|nr:YbaB/EbfC family nucleoid-associated protein [Propionibacteriaceae bacterium]